MDDKFRLAFAETGNVPLGDAYIATEAQAFDRLQDALEATKERPAESAQPYIAHKYIVFSPGVIDVLVQQFGAKQ